MLVFFVFFTLFFK